MKYKALLPIITVALLIVSISCTKQEPYTLIIGTYTHPSAMGNSNSSSAYIAKFDQEIGQITIIDSLHAGFNASYIAADTRKQILYAVNELNGNEPQGKVRAYIYTIPWSSARLLSECSTMGNDPCYVSVSANEGVVSVANYSSGNISVFPTNSDGSLNCTKATAHQHHGLGPHANQASPHAHQAIGAPFGNYIYSCDLGCDDILVYSIDTQTSIPSVVHTIRTAAGAGPRHLAFHPTKNFAYVINELNGTIESFAVDTKNGNLEKIQTIATSDDGATDRAASADIHITSDGKYLYASNRGGMNDIACFAIDNKKGTLTRKGNYSSGGKGPRNFSISPNNRFMIVANQHSNNIVVMSIDKATGALTPTGSEIKLYAPVCITNL